MRQIRIAVIGKGTVGRPFLRQFISARSRHRTSGVDLAVVAVAGRTHACVQSGGIADEQLGAIAAGADISSLFGTRAHGGWKDLSARFAEARVDAVADLTADENADAHAEWADRGWSVATANKKPLTGSMSAWRRMMRVRGRYGFSAACGAGLPVLETVSRLVASGDVVKEVRGMVSGTLGFLFSACDAGGPFAGAVEEAHRRGYTEPDPRDDLSGADCGRKALIIARLLGRRIELPDIAVENLVPEELRAGDAEEFLSRLTPGAFGALDARINAARADGKALRYLVTVTPERVVVRIEPVERASPFGRLAGPENMFTIRSARYDAVPFTIAGPGAGGEVTAGAVLADLLRLIDPMIALHSSQQPYART